MEGVRRCCVLMIIHELLSHWIEYNAVSCYNYIKYCVMYNT